jgi:hypothetical protein
VVRPDRRPGHLPQPGISQLREPLAHQLRPTAPRSPAARPASPGRLRGGDVLRAIVLRSTPRLCAISLLFRPACQWTRISMMSTTSKVLLAIGLPPDARIGRNAALALMARSSPTRSRPHGELRDRAGELRDRYRPTVGIS